MCTVHRIVSYHILSYRVSVLACNELSALCEHLVHRSCRALVSLTWTCVFCAASARDKPSRLFERVWTFPIIWMCVSVRSASVSDTHWHSLSVITGPKFELVIRTAAASCLQIISCFMSLAVNIFIANYPKFHGCHIGFAARELLLCSETHIINESHLLCVDKISKCGSDHDLLAATRPLWLHAFKNMLRPLCKASRGN